MNAEKNIQKIETKIEAIKKELQALGPIHPGSVSMQYNVCGKKVCRCKDPENPRRHGPYYKLNYVFEGKKTSQFVREEDVKELQVELANYKNFRHLTNEWIRLSIEAAKLRAKLPR